MSEVDLTILGRTDYERSERRDSKVLTPMQQVNDALKECGFGWFHVRILCASYMAFSAGILITNTTPYILPNAECDLNMNLLQKGVLTATPYVGMILSSICAGFLVDTFGRKLFLVGGYGLMAFFNVVSGFAQNYTWMVTSKLCEGLVFGAAFSPSITFTSEFCHTDIRDRVMLLQSSFAPTNQIILAGFSWAVLMRDWKTTFFDSMIVLNTWNFYLLIASVYAMLATILYSVLPESPRYLASHHRYDEAREVLIKVYKSNKGKSADTFSYVNIWKDKNTHSIDETDEHGKATLGQQLTAGLHNVKPLFQKPYVHYLMMIGTMMLFVMLLYNVIRMWFPQLSTIVEHYATEDNQELCTMLDEYTKNERIKRAHISNATEICVPVSSGTDTYINSLILGCSCLIPYFLTGLLVNKVGKKILIIGSGIICISASLGLRWSSSRSQVVALFAVAMAASQVMMSLLQATSIEFFPTTVRTLAVSMIMTCGRIGSLLGNVVFPVLLNMACEVPFYSLGGVMIYVSIALQQSWSRVDAIEMSENKKKNTDLLYLRKYSLIPVTAVKVRDSAIPESEKEIIISLFLVSLILTAVTVVTLLATFQSSKKK